MHFEVSLWCEIVLNDKCSGNNRFIKESLLMKYTWIFFSIVACGILIFNLLKSSRIKVLH